MPDTPDLEFLTLQEALLGRYSLERELGRGGMGVVYLAHEVRLDRPVALKLLPTRLAAQPILRARFLQEARTAGKLSHPNIVPIYAVDEVDDFVFFAMAFVEGESLGQRIRERGPLRPAEATRILREVSKLRLGSVASTGAAYGHTEMAIGMAADRLFDRLPKDIQKSLSELPDVVRTLEQDADSVRSRLKELDALLAQIESAEPLGKSGRVAASPGVADKRNSLAEDLRGARDAADARLSEVVAALEKIRLELLRLHTGPGSVEDLTADLSSARELSEDIELVLEGEREVEKLLAID